MHNWTGRRLLTPLSADATGRLRGGTSRVGTSPVGKSSCTNTLGPTTLPHPPLICWPPKFLLPPRLPPSREKPYFKCLLILQSVLLSMLSEHKLRAETLLLDQRSGNDGPALEPDPAGHLFLYSSESSKEFLYF